MKSQRRFAPITGRFQPDSVAVLPGMRTQFIISERII